MKKISLLFLLAGVLALGSGCLNTSSVEVLSPEPVDLRNKKIAVVAVADDKYSDFLRLQMAGYLNGFPDVKVLKNERIEHLDDQMDGRFVAALGRLGRGKTLSVDIREALKALGLDYILQVAAGDITETITTTRSSTGGSTSVSSYSAEGICVITSVKSSKPLRRITMTASVNAGGCMTKSLYMTESAKYKRYYTFMDKAANIISTEIADRYYRFSKPDGEESN